MLHFLTALDLAWHNLIGDRRRLLLALCGIGFAVVLMFTQNGFRNALFDSTVRIVRLFEADLIVVSDARYNLANEQRFPKSFLRRAALVKGVASAEPVYLERVMANLRVMNHTSRPIRVIGVEPKAELFADAELANTVSKVNRPGLAIVDRRSKSSYGFDLNSDSNLANQVIELSDHRLQCVSTFSLGTDFVHDGNLLVSDQTLAEIFATRNNGGEPLEVVDLGLIRLTPGESPEQLKATLTALAPNEIRVFTPDELVAREVQFWSRNTPIGIIFSIGTIMGLVVGTIICYQILYNDISDQIAELATLKAMGYSPFYFLQLVLRQAFYLGCFGFIPGLLLSWGLFTLLSAMTGLIMQLTIARIVMVFALTLSMCFVSGLLAVRRLWTADPASLF